MKQLFIYHYHDDYETIRQSFEEFDRQHGESEDDYEDRAIKYVQERRKKGERREEFTLYWCEEVEVPPHKTLSEEELAKVREEISQIDSEMADTYKRIREASQPLQNKLESLKNRHVELRSILLDNR